MAGFASVDEILNALSVNNRGQRLQYQKTVPAVNVADVWHSFWKGPGMPIAGGDPTLGMAGAAVCTDATAGAIPFTNASGGRTMHLLHVGLMSQQAVMSILLVDRIAHARIANAQATASFAPVLDATSRLATGEGGQIVMEVTTALSAAANVRTFTYTNEAGTGGRVTQQLTTVASAVVNRVPYARGIYVPLATGDMGVRSIESTSLVSGTATGEYTVAIVRPLAWIQVHGPSFFAERDFILDLPNLQRIYDDSCLAAYMISSSAGSTFNAQAEIRIAEN